MNHFDAKIRHAHRDARRTSRTAFVLSVVLAAVGLIGMGFGIWWLLADGLPALGDFLLKLKAA